MSLLSPPLEEDIHMDSDVISLLHKPSIEEQNTFQLSSVKYLVDIYNSVKDKDNEVDDDVYDYEIAQTKRRYTRDVDERIDKYNHLITFISKPYQPNITDFKGISMKFNLTGIPFDYFLTKAEIRLYHSSILSNLSHTDKNFTVAVWDIKNSDTKRMQISQDVLSSYQEWLHLDVTTSITAALNQRKQEIEFLISTHCEGSEVDPEEFGLIGVDSNPAYQPFLIGFFDGLDAEFLPNVDLSERRKRSPNFMKIFEDDFDQSEESCNRINFTIHFKDIGMDDVVLAPKSFDAFYCSGECNFPLQVQMNATNHALIQTLANLKDPGIPKSRCTPRTLGSIRVLEILSEGSTILKDYRNTVVKTCGCQ